MDNGEVKKGGDLLRDGAGIPLHSGIRRTSDQLDNVRQTAHNGHNDLNILHAQQHRVGRCLLPVQLGTN